MYEEFYGLREKPFDLLPDADYLYMSSGHDSAYTHLQYAVRENKGFVVITGEIGSGKTTLINYLLRQLPEDLRVAVISQTDVAPELFFKLICRKFNLPYRGLDKGEMLLEFQDFILESRRHKQRIVLIIDEAQNLPDETIEEIRMLSNLEAERELLVQIILVGQPELQEKLRRPHLRQFLQRVSVHYHLEHLNAEEVKEYIRHRLQVAGCANYTTLFDEEATRLIWEVSSGVPRMINYICDLALVHGYADGIPTIDAKIIAAVADSRQQSDLFSGVASAKGHCEILDGGLEAGGLESRFQNLERFLEILEIRSVEQTAALKAANRHNAELLSMLRESLQQRQQLALSFQTLHTRYRKLYRAAQNYLRKHRKESRQ